MQTRFKHRNSQIAIGRENDVSLVEAELDEIWGNVAVQGDPSRSSKPPI